MKQSTYKTYDDLPLFLKIGNRMVVPKEKFVAWVEQNTTGGGA